MDSPMRQLFIPSVEKIIAYLPNLFAGLILIGLGWLIAWLVKRVVFQMCLLFKLDRVLQRFNWGRALAKADIRYAVYNSIGNVAFFASFLIFLHSGLSVMNLAVLSDLLEGAVFFLPRLLVALSIFIIGWMISDWVAGAIQKALLKEDFPRATLLARFSKLVLLLFFSAMALTELNVAREIVVIGFTTIIITLGVLVVVVTAGGGKTLIKTLFKTLDEE
jgi:Mechanosensitive ion channel, conserved TM helix